MKNKFATKGAGLLFICPQDNTILLLKRSDKVGEPNTWGLPGGGLEKNETFAQAALREGIEEVGSLPKAKLFKIINNINDDKVFRIFVFKISLNEKQKWEPKLNWEHSGFSWFKTSKIPQRLHPSLL